MDFFLIQRDTWDVFDRPGVEISGADKISWVERFDLPGEFTIIGKPDELMASFPLNTLISHSLTDTIMLVETHSIDESEGETAKVKITGRTLDACFMDDRVVCFNKDLVDPGVDIWEYDEVSELSIYPMEFQTTGIFSWDFVKSLLVNHLQDTLSGDTENIPNLFVMTSGFDEYTDNDGYRCTKRLSYLSDAVYDQLQSSDIGLKVCRPGPERLELETKFVDDGGSFDPDGPEKSLLFVVYRGEDLSDEITFDVNNGDLNKARYFWTIRDQKTGYYSGNQWHTARYFDDVTGTATRMGLADANDYEPISGDSTEIYSVLSDRGKKVLNRNHLGGHVLVDAVIAKGSEVKYQKDYKLGDIINVLGNYGVNQRMRVVEVATIQEGGVDSTIPTLRAVYNEESPDPM